MSCKGKTGKELKDCNNKSRISKLKATQKTDKKDDKKKPVTVPDLDAANFKNKDVVKWSEKNSKVPDRTKHRAVRGLATLANRTKIPRLGKK
jgi:hypothetical protein